MKKPSLLKKLYLSQEGRRRPFVEDRSLQLENGDEKESHYIQDVNPLYIANQSAEFDCLDQEFQHLLSVAKDLEAAYHEILQSQDQKTIV